MHKEREFHKELDRRGLRYEAGSKREVFKARGRGGVNELISAMRTLRGDKMFLCSGDSISEDQAYRGGSRRGQNPAVKESSVRATQERDAKPKTYRLSLSRKKIEALREGDTELLNSLIQSIF